MLPGVFIGDAADARDAKLLTEAGITRILTVHTESFATCFPSTTTHNLLVCATDEEDTDLLSQLQTCIDFIAAALEAETNVLVHWCVGCRPG